MQIIIASATASIPVKQRKLLALISLEPRTQNRPAATGIVSLNMPDVSSDNKVSQQTQNHSATNRAPDVSASPGSRWNQPFHTLNISPNALLFCKLSVKGGTGSFPANGTAPLRHWRRDVSQTRVVLDFRGFRYYIYSKETRSQSED
jgi:hypothetical protein